MIWYEFELFLLKNLLTNIEIESIFSLFKFLIVK